jgi:Ca2+-binding RTX toxin-like protein
MAATAGNDTIDGTAGNDIIDGLGGDDVIAGGLGADTIRGGAGEDRFDIRGAADIVAGESYAGGADSDMLKVTANGLDISLLTIAADVERLSATSADFQSLFDIKLTAAQLSGFRFIDARSLTVTTAGVADLRGNIFVGNTIKLGVAGVELYLPDDWWGDGNLICSEGADTVTGSNDADSVDGKGGDDVLSGGRGEDNLTGGAGADLLSGGSDHDWLQGGAGIDTLDGGDGRDHLTLSGADDRYDRFDGGADYDRLVLEGEGSRLRAGTAIVNVEELQSTGAVGIDAAMIRKFTAFDTQGLTIATAGNADFRGLRLSEQAITLGVGGIVLNLTGHEYQAVVGSNGNDTVIASTSSTIAGRGGDDVLNGGAGGDWINGGAGLDTIKGGTGVDRIDGGAGLDTINGGDGNDVVTIAAAADVVAGEQYIGGLGWDHLFVKGEEIDLTGAAITGFESLNARRGAVKLTLAQIESFDMLWAGSVVIATAGEFSPTGNIYTNAFTLAVGGITLDLSGDQYEAYVVKGSAGNDIVTGGGKADTIYGYGGDDVLNSGNSSGDLLAGGAGDDLYRIETSWPKVVEGSAQGHDTVHTNASAMTLAANVEDMILIGPGGDDFLGTGNQGDNRIVAAAGDDTLKGAAGNDTLEGAAGKDALTGGVGDDSLYGGAGLDQLSGGDGADRFVFDSALGAAHNVDRVMDFAADDFMVLDRNVFGAAGPQARLAGDAFTVGTAARDAEDRLVYDQASGKLFYDADGTGAGAQILFAQLSAGAELGVADFQIVG